MAENRMGAVRETAGQEGTAVARHAADAVGEVTSTAREQVGQVAGEAVGQAKHVARDMRDRVASEAEQQTRKVSQQINRIADELHSMAENSSDDSMTAGALRQVADTGRQAARFLDERGAKGLLDSAQHFARRKPGAFLLGAAVAGFLVGRVAKSMGGSDSGNGGRPDYSPALPVARPDPRFGAPEPAFGSTDALATPAYGTPVPQSDDLEPRFGGPGPQTGGQYGVPVTPAPQTRSPYESGGLPHVQP